MRFCARLYEGAASCTRAKELRTRASYIRVILGALFGGVSRAIHAVNFLCLRVICRLIDEIGMSAPALI